jgi:acyl carrier protein
VPSGEHEAAGQPAGGYEAHGGWRGERVNANAIYRKLRTLIAETLGVDEEDVVPEASFEEDLNADHQELVDLMVAIEEEFDVRIPDDDMANLTTVGDAVEYLEDKLA